MFTIVFLFSLNKSNNNKNFPHIIIFYQKKNKTQNLQCLSSATIFNREKNWLIEYLPHLVLSSNWFHMINIYTTRRKNSAKFRLAISEDVPAILVRTYWPSNGFFSVRLQSNFFCESKQISCAFSERTLRHLFTNSLLFFFSFRRTNKNVHKW